MPESFDLSSATDRKAIEAAVKSDKHAIAAALAVLMDPACSECGGKGRWIERRGPGTEETPVACPACNGSGQNPDQLVKLSEVVEQIKEWPASMDYPLSVTQREGVASALERWARERPA